MDKKERNSEASRLATFPKLDIKTNDNQVFEIPAEGSLGLLALGDVGLIAWRQKKLQVLQEHQAQIGN